MYLHIFNKGVYKLGAYFLNISASVTMMNKIIANKKAKIVKYSKM